MKMDKKKKIPYEDLCRGMKTFWIVWAVVNFVLAILFAFTDIDWYGIGMSCLFAVCQIDICNLKEDIRRLEQRDERN